MYSTVFFFCQSGMSQVTAKTNSLIGRFLSPEF